MKVFIIEPHKEYAHGSILIAANSEEEAKNLYFGENEFNQFCYETARCSCREFKDLYYEGNDIILSDALYIDNVTKEISNIY